MFSRLKDIFSGWWEGKLQEKSLDEIFDDSAVDMYSRHWTAVVARALVTFYLLEWKWLWVFALSALGLYFAYLKL